MDQSLIFARIGAVGYMLWGAWHLRVVYAMFQFAEQQMDPGLLQVRVRQGAFHILFFALAALLIGALGNWKNNQRAYWANLITIGWTEIGLFWLLILPGTFPWLPLGWIGPSTWLLAVVFTSLGIFFKTEAPVLQTQ